MFMCVFRLFQFDVFFCMFVCLVSSWVPARNSHTQRCYPFCAIIAGRPFFYLAPASAIHYHASIWGLARVFFRAAPRKLARRLRLSVRMQLDALIDCNIILFH